MTDREAFEKWASDSGDEDKEKNFDALRGQLQNCANLLHRLKRHGYAGDAAIADVAIDSANRVLYETL